MGEPQTFGYLEHDPIVASAFAPLCANNLICEASMAARFVQDYAARAAAPYLAQCLGYQQITSLSSATNLTVPANASFALINVEGTAGTDFVRWRDDGTAPTTTVGMLMGSVPASSTTLLPEQAQMLYSGDLTAIQFIGSGSPKLNISYYR